MVLPAILFAQLFLPLSVRTHVNVHVKVYYIVLGYQTKLTSRFYSCSEILNSS